MANSNFEMIGKLSLSKGTDKFPTYEKRTVGETGEAHTLRMMVKADGNTHNVQINGLFWGENSKIYTMEKTEDNKGKKLEFMYKEKDKYIDKIVEYKKFVFVDGESRHEFITERDFALFVKDELPKRDENERYIVKGNIEFKQYKGKTYYDYDVNRIYVVHDEDRDEPLLDKSEGTLDLYIAEGCVDDEQFEETRKMFIKCYATKYDKNKKGEVGIPTNIEVFIPKEKKNGAKLVDKIKENLAYKIEDDEKVCKVNLKVDLINKSEKVDFNVEMCTEEERENLEMGLIDIEDLKAEYGCGKGSFEKKFVFKGFGRGYLKGAMPQELLLTDLLAFGEKKSESNTEYQIDSDDNGLDDIDVDDDDDSMLD